VDLINKGEQFLGRVLEVGVHYDDDVALGVGEASGDGGLVAEIAGEADDFQAPVGGSKALADFQRTVAAAVIDDDKLEGLFPSERGGGDAAIELFNAILLIERRNDNGNHARPNVIC